jgi:hypothetical protein
MREITKAEEELYKETAKILKADVTIKSKIKIKKFVTKLN